MYTESFRSKNSLQFKEECNFNLVHAVECYSVSAILNIINPLHFFFFFFLKEIALHHLIHIHLCLVTRVLYHSHLFP